MTERKISKLEDEIDVIVGLAVPCRQRVGNLVNWRAEDMEEIRWICPLGHAYGAVLTVLGMMLYGTLAGELRVANPRRELLCSIRNIADRDPIFAESRRSIMLAAFEATLSRDEEEVLG